MGKIVSFVRRHLRAWVQLCTTALPNGYAAGFAKGTIYKGAGGYTFSRDSAPVALKRVTNAACARFASAAWRSGDTDMECLVAFGMANVMDGIYGERDALCRTHLNSMTIQYIDRTIFGADVPRERGIEYEGTQL